MEEEGGGGRREGCGEGREESRGGKEEGNEKGITQGMKGHASEEERRKEKTKGPA